MPQGTSQDACTSPMELMKGRVGHGSVKAAMPPKPIGEDKCGTAVSISIQAEIRRPFTLTPFYNYREAALPYVLVSLYKITQAGKLG